MMGITTYNVARQISETIVHIVVQAPTLTWRLLRVLIFFFFGFGFGYFFFFFFVYF